tara:strand:+ start:84 stop:350 length:267 start_codon:yes stop_codon:yes gene_type:complete
MRPGEVRKLEKEVIALRQAASRKAEDSEALSELRSSNDKLRKDLSESTKKLTASEKKVKSLKAELKQTQADLNESDATLKALLGGDDE